MTAATPNGTLVPRSSPDAHTRRARRRLSGPALPHAWRGRQPFKRWPTRTATPCTRVRGQERAGGVWLKMTVATGGTERSASRTCTIVRSGVSSRQNASCDSGRRAISPCQKDNKNTMSKRTMPHVGLLQLSPDSVH